jgi:hypothetical protein
MVELKNQAHSEHKTKASTKSNALALVFGLRRFFLPEIFVQEQAS